MLKLGVFTGFQFPVPKSFFASTLRASIIGSRPGQILSTDHPNLNTTTFIPVYKNPIINMGIKG